MTRPTVIAALIVAATILFAVGTTIERNQGDTHPAGESAEQRAAETGGESAEEHATEEEGESAEAHEAEGEPGASTESEQDESDEEILGIDPESPGLVIVAVIVSLLMAAAILRRPTSGALLIAVGLAMLAFAALDIREVVHQIDEDRTGLAILAGAVAALHLCAAAACLVSRSRRPAPVT